MTQTPDPLLRAITDLLLLNNASGISAQQIVDVVVRTPTTQPPPSTEPSKAASLAGKLRVQAGWEQSDEWFMAKRGWTLQRSRANVEFANLADDIQARKLADSEAFKKFIESRKQASTAISVSP